MVMELEKPRIVEIQVRIDCYGCVQKIKKAISGIHGICDLHFDFPEQKVTVVGWAEEDEIVRAIRKTRKSVTVFSQVEETRRQVGPRPEEEQVPSSEKEATAPQSSPPPQSDQQPPPPTEASLTTNSTDDPPAPEKTLEVDETVPPRQAPPSGKISDETREVRDCTHSGHGRRSGYTNDRPFLLPHEPPPYFAPPRFPHRYGGNWSPPFHEDRSKNYSQSSPLSYEPTPPARITQRYSSYKPSSHVTEYDDPRATLTYGYYGCHRHVGLDSRGGDDGDGNLTSMFSDENPNACNIV